MDFARRERKEREERVSTFLLSLPERERICLLDARRPFRTDRDTKLREREEREEREGEREDGKIRRSQVGKLE